MRKQSTLTQLVNGSQVPVTSITYAGNYEQVTTGGNTYGVNYITTPDGLSLMYVYDKNAKQATYYHVHTDHLGSIEGVYYAGDVNHQNASNGGLVYAQSFDSWGRVRNETDWSYTATTLTKPDWLIRGYTGHEMLTQVGLINMNARLYDPLVGRMLGPDNQGDPSSSQGVNRFTYANNNPLKYTDPTGNWVEEVNQILEDLKAGFSTGTYQGGGNDDAPRSFESFFSSDAANEDGFGGNFTGGCGDGGDAGTVTYGPIQVDITPSEMAAAEAQQGLTTNQNLQDWQVWTSGGNTNSANVPFMPPVEFSLIDAVNSTQTAETPPFVNAVILDAPLPDYISNVIYYTRTNQNDVATTGSFFLLGAGINGFFLEPNGPETTTANLNQCIPAGCYDLNINIGNVVGLRLSNENVSSDRAILIHVGNSRDDTHGCLLAGSGSNGVNYVTGSKAIMNQIMNYFTSGSNIVGAQIIITNGF